MSGGKSLLGWTLVVVAIAAAATYYGWLRQHSARLRAEVGVLRQKEAKLRQSRDEESRLDTLIQQSASRHSAARETIQAELVRLRREIAALEQRASQAPGTAPATINRDPEQGPTTVEHFRDMGRATPSAAFQTLVWAARKGGQDDELASTLSLEGTARTNAEALYARLGDEAKKKYPTPAHLAALAVTAELLRGGTLHIVAQFNGDRQRGSVSVRTGTNPKTIELPMRAAPGGWQLVVPEQAIAALEQRL